MQLTLALTSLNRSDDETLPPLPVPAFNQILRYGRLQRAAVRPSEFYGRHLWQGSLLERAKAKIGLPQAQSAAFASPVWQQMGLHQAKLLEGRYLDIAEHEAAALCRELSEFYADAGWQFHVVSPDLWLLTLPDTPQWGAPPAFNIGGQISHADQAGGRDAADWLAKQTESQMWLFAHPLNQTRRAAKLPEINGLWLWQEVAGEAAHQRVYSDSPWAAFAEQSAPLPPDFAAWLAQNPPANSLIFSDGLNLSAQTGDVAAYAEQLDYWERAWFAPAWQALNTGRLKKLVLRTDGENGGELVLTPKSKWAFWKADKSFKGIW